MPKTRNKLRRNRLEAAQPASKSSKIDLIKLFLFIISFFGLLLALLGYGYTLGLSIPFGYGPLEVVNSTGDFLYNSTVPLMAISSKVLKLDFWFSLFLSSYFIRWVVGITAGCLFIYLFVRFIRSQPKRHSATREWFEDAEKSIGFLDRAVLDDEPIKGFFRVLITTPLYIYFGFFILFLVIYFVLLAVITVPMLGYNEGQKIAEDIKNATSCSEYDIENAESETNKKDKHAKPKAQCVKIMQGGKEIARGRVIATNSQRILLYVRETTEDGKLVRIPKSYPIRNAIIERVDTEDLPTVNHSGQSKIKLESAAD